MNDKRPGSVETVSSTDTGKRSFIKKATVVAGISTLAPTSAWGLCNASGVSGGSQNMSGVCVVPNYPEGRGPEFWKKFLKDNPTWDDKVIAQWFITDVDSHTEFTNGETLDKASATLHLMKSDLLGSNKRSFYYHKIADFLRDGRLQFTVEKYDSNVGKTTQTINVSNALLYRSHSYEGHLAAVYLNVVFGLSELPHEFNVEGGLSMLLDHYYGVAHFGAGLITDLNSMYRNQEILEHDLINVLGKLV